jgi:hypothetical protein
MKAETYTPTYFEVQKKSRGQRPIGEVFACKIRGVGYIFGRVIRDDCAIACDYNRPQPWNREKGLYLLYFFKGVSNQPSQLPSLSADNLLFAPCKTTLYSWNKGYFLPVATLPFGANEILPTHCFTKNNLRGPFYFTEYGEPLTGPLEYCIYDYIYGCRTIEEQIAKGLGLPFEDSGGWTDTGTRSGSNRVINNVGLPPKQITDQVSGAKPRRKSPGKSLKKDS